MDSVKNPNPLIDVLSRELKLLNMYNKGCESLHKHLVARDWVNLESILNSLKKDADGLADLDIRRESIVNYMKRNAGLAEEVSFGLLLSTLDDDSQKKIQELKRKIRRAVSILQVRLKGIGAYSENQTNVLKDVLDELVPGQKGQIYNSSGLKSSRGDKPMLFNHHI